MTTAGVTLTKRFDDGVTSAEPSNGVDAQSREQHPFYATKVSRFHDHLYGVHKPVSRRKLRIKRHWSTVKCVYVSVAGCDIKGDPSSSYSVPEVDVCAWQAAYSQTYDALPSTCSWSACNQFQNIVWYAFVVVQMIWKHCCKASPCQESKVSILSPCFWEIISTCFMGLHTWSLQSVEMNKQRVQNQVWTVKVHIHQPAWTSTAGTSSCLDWNTM